MFLEIKEGSTAIFVPKERSKSIFYNSKMKLSRDIDVASVASFFSFSHSDLSCVDALAGTGVRGVRVAKEVGLRVDINDWSKDAYEVIKRNIRRNEVENKATACNEDTNVLLLRRKYDIVDIDPFGSPAPFLDSACKSSKRLMLITATDTAPLCGAHPSGIRKYDAVPLNTEYHKEIATRILLGALIRCLAKYNKSAKPLLSYSKEHFIRAIVGVEEGAKKAEHSIKRLGFISHCFSCGKRFAFYLADMLELSIEGRCSECNSKIRISGPLYIEEIKDKKFCECVLSKLKSREMGMKKEAVKIIGTCAEELDIPFYYEHHNICKRMKKIPSSISLVIEGLKGKGFSASRTHFSNTAFKTDASIKEIEGVLKFL